MGYYPPSPISNSGWEYHQESTDSEQPNQWGYASENYQDNFMRYCPPPQDDLDHYPHGDCKYQQGMREYEQSSEMNYFPKPQIDSYCYDTDINYGCEGNYNDSHSNHSKALSLDYAISTYLEECSSMPQNNPHCNEFNNHSSCGWEDQNQTAFNSSYSTHQKSSSLECAFNEFLQNCLPMPQDEPYCDEFNNSSSCAWEDQNQKALNVSYSINQEPSSLEQTFNSFMLNCPTSPPSSPLENFSSLNFASTQSFLQGPYNSFHKPQNSFHNSQNSLHTPQNKSTITHPCSQNYSKPPSLELTEDLLQKSREFSERQEQS
ncbi:hypothetical protein AHAS_Ahas11G0173800 [Arachis hypogaea]